jgi:uncharacterized membrane protein
VTAAPVAAPSQRDRTVEQASQIVGGAWGRHAVAGRWWTPIRVLLALCMFTLLLGYLEKAPCADGNWTAYKQYSHVCYSDVIPLWGAEGLDLGQVPYRDHAVEYPVLTGGFMWLTASLTHGVRDVTHTHATDVEVFGAISCLLLAVCGLLTVAATAGSAGRRPYDAALFALSPLLVFHAFSNWDLLAMALASGALWAWARSKPVLAGILIGLGAAAKLYPALLLLPILVLAWRTRVGRPAAWCAIAAAFSWIAVNAPIGLAYHAGWWEFYRLSIERPAEASTFWFMGNYLATVGPGGGYPPSWQPPGAAVALVFLLALAAVAAIALLAPFRPRMGQLAFLVVLAFLLTTKVWSPQYSLWLVPLLALARPRWRISVIWQVAEIAVWALTLWWLMGFGVPTRGVEYQWLMFALLIRDGLLIAIAALVIREMWRPELDVVRSDGLDDPGGGPYDGATHVPWRPPWKLPEHIEPRHASVET